MTATAPAAPAKVYFTNLRTHARESQLDKLKRLIRRAGIEQIDFENKFVAIKIHFGELGNLSFLRPNYARAVADVVKELGGKPILDNCSLTVHRGELKVLIGPSGAGKSTLLQCIDCLIPPDSGEIWLEGEPLVMNDRRRLCAYRAQVGMIFQDFNLFDHLTAEENVAIALRKVRGMSRKDAKARALEELGRVGLARRALLYPAQLSGGQKQRVAIARALAMDPKVILLDEPTSALDPELVGEVLAVIRDLARGGMTMIMATHQMDFARALATDILFMEQGKIIEQGAPDVLLAPGSGTRTSDFCGKLFDLRGTEKSDGPSSQAARMVMALAGPIPLYCVSSLMDFFPSWFRLLSQSFRMRFIRSTALSSVDPEPIRIPKSSALDKAEAPKRSSFSRGLSSSAQLAMVSFSAIIITD